MRTSFDQCRHCDATGAERRWFGMVDVGPCQKCMGTGMLRWWDHVVLHGSRETVESITYLDSDGNSVTLPADRSGTSGGDDTSIGNDTTGGVPWDLQLPCRKPRRYSTKRVRRLR